MLQLFFDLLTSPSVADKLQCIIWSENTKWWKLKQCMLKYTYECLRRVYWQDTANWRLNYNRNLAQNTIHVTFEVKKPVLFFFLTLQVRSRDSAAPIGAFMWPLHWSMWVGIFVTLHLTALFLTLYEWNSPFGMTPHGRNRLRVFSYSSALNLCYAILFGRTVATKVQ